MIVVVLPSGRKVSCGFTEQLYERWNTALHSCKCRKVLRQEGLLGLLFGVLVIGGVIGGGLLGWYLGTAILMHIVPQIQNNRFANLLPAMMSILFSWLFAVAPWLIPGWRRYTASERIVFRRSAILFPLKIAIPAGALLAGNVIAGFACAVILISVFLVVSQWLSKSPRPATYE